MNSDDGYETDFTASADSVDDEDEYLWNHRRHRIIKIYQNPSQAGYKLSTRLHGNDVYVPSISSTSAEPSQGPSTAYIIHGARF